MGKFSLMEGRYFLIFSVLYLVILFILYKGYIATIAGFSFLVGATIVYIYFYELKNKI